MPDGELSTDGAESSIAPEAKASSTPSPIVEIGKEVEAKMEKKEKDPRKIARKYQLELCKKATEENIIVYLETGCGKTHIAVLLIYELGHLIRKPQKRICIFLAPTVALVQQQARVIEDSLDFKVGIFSGNCRHLKNHHDWAKEIEQYEVLVMTPQILLRSLYHCFIRMNLIALLIFDECHHAQIRSNHPYAEIMKVFYDKASASMLPRIFGMTASPVVGKGASSQVNLPKSINSLENLLDAKVYSVGDKEELESFVATPVVKVYDYGPVSVGPSSSYVLYCSKLEEIKRQCISTLVRKNGDFQSVRNTKKLLNRMQDNIIFCLENLGLWGALQACQLLLTGNNSERSDLIEDEGISSDDSVCDRYLAQADDVFASDCKRDGSAHDLSDVEILKEPFFSKKLLRLVGILSTFRVQPNMKCIIFVNRIVTARSLSYILQNLKFLLSWKCHFLVGVHSGLKSMSRRTMNSILEKFRTGELNLLVATKVGEEGLDIQTCCLVIRFDLPETVASFIQSRGRARMPLSEYAFLVNSGNERELNLINNFKKDEDRMNMEITYRTSTEVSVGLEERMYTVPSSGASISSGYSVSLLHQYCSKLPHDEYFHPKPSFYYFDDTGGTICNIILPSNAPINQISSTPQSSVNAAKKDACLKAIEELHKLGALSDHLLPLQNSVLEEEMVLLSSDSENSEDEDTRGELHEMLVPALLKEPWTNLENYVLYSYYIKLIPNPEDRSYKEFALFVKSPLPEEAERMELDLHLARHRSVISKLIPSGVAEFKREEIMEAQHFQEMFFKVILDRSKLLSEFVPLGNDFLSSSSSTFYLLLPVIPSSCEGKMTVDWGIVQRCLSSPLFMTPEEAAKHENFPSDVCLQLVNGCRSIRDIENSLVYATHKEAFYFITNIVGEKNGYSPYRDSGTLNHVEHLKMSNIHLKYPEQPLLHAKPLFKLHNLLHNRKPQDSESHELEEYFIDLPPELCQLKIIGFSKDIGSSLSLLPSIMHRLENLLVAIELKHVFSASFAEGAEVTVNRVLEALTTEKCQERFSLERLETLGDSFLKFAVGRHLFLLHDALDEGQLTGRRSNVVNNSNLLKLATRRNLQVYIRDQPFDPCQFFALGYPCPVICTKETNGNVSQYSCQVDRANSGVRCSRNHHWLHKKTIADVVEALVGAFIVDSGFQAATAFLRWIGIRVDFQGPQVNSICAASQRFIPLSSQVDTVALEKLLGYRFLHKGLLFQAFVHPSYNRHGGGCFQRLEFLGDAVLDFLITSYLFSLYPNLKPGQLTDLRSVAVNNTSFANVAVEKCLHEFLIADSYPLKEAIEKYVNFFTSSPDRGLFEGPKCPKALGDLVEACFGAILLDTGFNLNHVWKIMLSLLDPIKSLSSVQLNPVREVTELCRSRSWKLTFLTSQSGKNFLVDGMVNAGDVPVSVSAISTNTRHATRTAAHEIYVKLKALGFAPKSKPLEEVLKGSCKGEAKLIGFDETPIDVDVPDITEFKNMKLQGSLVNDSNLETGSINKTTTSTDSPCISPISGQPHSFQTKAGCSASSVKVKGTLSDCSNVDTSCGIDSQSKGELQNRTARSQLYETCAINCWKPPLFECSKDEGPSHLRSFTYKVIVEIEDAPDMILECFSNPQTTKKAAAEHAAEGALWYLKHEGYLQ